MSRSTVSGRLAGHTISGSPQALVNLEAQLRGNFLREAAGSQRFGQDSLVRQMSGLQQAADGALALAAFPLLPIALHQHRRAAL